MKFEAEINLFRKITDNLHINTSALPCEESPNVKIDMGIRRMLGMEQDYEKIFLKADFVKDNNTLYRYKDKFRCCYFYIPLTACENSFFKFIWAGPFCTVKTDKTRLLEICKRNSFTPNIVLQLDKYYTSVPYIDNEKLLYAAVNALAETIFGSSRNYKLETIDELDTGEDYFFERIAEQKEEKFTPLDINVLEERYETENALMSAVSQGMLHKAEMMMMGSFAQDAIEKRTEDEIKNIQYYMIILNTILRKAAEYGSVHPLYIDRISTDFSIKIQNMQSAKDSDSLMREMVNKYCRLVQRHCAKGYSLIVQKVLTRIDADLTADLSLKTQAEHLSVSPSYLSSHFKKETGKNLTDYINEKRMEKAALLLQTSNLQIQTVAQKCGILDVNYFTKLFKKYKGTTPREYREQHKN